MSKNKTIFIGGMCSLPMGVMERQLGNMAILIPTLEQIKAKVNDVKIITSLQLSKDFCQEHDIESLDIPELYAPKIKFGLVSIFDFIRSWLWKFMKFKIKLDVPFLISGRKFKYLLEANLFLDFSGDTYGDIAFWGHFLKHSIDLLTIDNLAIPIFIFSQSPGPFSKKWRKSLAFNVLNKAKIITLREPVAYEYISKLGITSPIISLACPSWLLHVNKNKNEIFEYLAQNENINILDKFVVGLNITGFNFAKKLSNENKYRENRGEAELNAVIDLIHYLIVERNYDVLMVSHVFRFNDHGEMIQGPDGKVSRQVYEMFINSNPKYKTKIHIVEKPLDVINMKKIIGVTDIFISGRLHAGVSAMSQRIPTILIAYSPKHYGFARLIGLEKQVVNGFHGQIDSSEIKKNVIGTLEHLDEIKNDMAAKLPLIMNQARRNFELINDFLENNHEGF